MFKRVLADSSSLGKYLAGEEQLNCRDYTVTHGGPIAPESCVRRDCETVVIGAGAAGLAALAALARAGTDVRCLEASDRIGGRILTVRDPLSPVPIELGAEFIHGRPPEIWDLIPNANLSVYEHSWEAVHVNRGRVVNKSEVIDIAGQLLSTVNAQEKDESFESLLRRSHKSPQAKSWASQYIESFNAARKERISAVQLKEDDEAAERIEGDRSFRILNGYDSIPQFLLGSIPDHSSLLHLNAKVSRIEWKRGHATVHYSSTFDGDTATVTCSQVIITVPLGVLQRDSIRFEPEPRKFLEAARKLEFGQVFRVTFRFPEPFWEEDERFQAMGFLISQEKPFLAWWTTRPVMSSILTGWCAGAAADQLLGAGRTVVINEALACLKKILNRNIPAPSAAWFEDWHANSLFGGAYSYVPVNGVPSRDVLTQSIESTLFFAGEATNNQGHGGTVHGAIATGKRAASQVLAL